MDAVTVFGLVAASCTTLAFLPQVLKNWKTRSAGDLSFGTYGLLVAGMVLWLIYGLLIGNLPIILSNIVTLFLTTTNLAQMIWFHFRGVPVKQPLDAGSSGDQLPITFERT